MTDEPQEIQHVRQEVARIRTLAGDPEAAHGAEDDLHRLVLLWISEGKGDAALAAEALKTCEIDFRRWCA